MVVCYCSSFVVRCLFVVVHCSVFAVVCHGSFFVVVCVCALVSAVRLAILAQRPTLRCERIERNPETRTKS